MTTLFPEIEPHASGHLDVGDGNHVYWETCGNPNGKPALIVHGGPGMGCVPNMRRSFDPAHYRIIVVPVEDRDGDLINAYAKLMEHSDESIREQAVRSWCTWEDEVLSLESNNKPNHYAERPSKDMLAFVRICTHYAANGAWLEEGEILKNASRLAGIPGVIIHGRRDLSCPAITAWQLAKAWPDAKLILLDDSGHLGSPSKRAALLAAHEQFNDA